MGNEALLSQLDAFEDAVRAERIDDARAAYEDILDMYEERRTDGLSTALRSRNVDFDEIEDGETLDEHLEAYLETLTIRYRFKLFGGMVVDRYEELVDTGEFDEVWNELQEAITELRASEPKLEESEANAKNVTDGVDIPPEVTILYTDIALTDPLAPGETDTVEVSISNLGNSHATGVTVVLNTAETISIVEESLPENIGEVAPNEEITRVYEFEITDEGDGWIEVELDSENAGKDKKYIQPPIEVEESTELDLEITDTNDPVVEGESLEVTAEIENTGNTNVQETIELDAGSLGTDTETVDLDGGETTTTPLRVQTESGDAGEYMATVVSSHERTISFDVIEESTSDGDYEIIIDDAPSSATVGDEVEIEFTVKITDYIPEDQDITIHANRQHVVTIYGDVESGQEFTDTHSFTVGSELAPETYVSLSGDDDSEMVTFPVNQPDDDEGSGDSSDGDSDGQPGFGVGGVLASLGGAAYLLKRRVESQDTEMSSSEDTD